MLDFTPANADSATGHAGTYRRSLPVDLERLYENALDWEHLPWVHPAAFRSIECVDLTPRSWRARTESPAGASSVIELTLDRACRRWVTRVLEGEGRGNEIWTHVWPAGARQVDIVIDFYLPAVPAPARSRVGAAYARLYAQLYDEDVAMMVERTRQLDRRPGLESRAPQQLALGARQDLSLPVRVMLGGREFVIVASDGALRAFPAQCPHMLGPLEAAGVEDGAVTCPWHGYRFDLATGRNLSGKTCALHPLPSVTVAADGVVWVSLPDR
jgi:nitrite reductase/ring-hydroxylating ferredoxin subunit